MTTTLKVNLKTFLEDLKSADLIGISLRPQNLGLRLDFTFGPEVGDVAIELYGIIHLWISRPLNSENEHYCFWVGDVQLRKLENPANPLLNSVSYPFHLNPNFDFSSLLYFRLEGDIFIEVICEHYKLFQEVKN
jgi:hypothetical protein